MPDTKNAPGIVSKSDRERKEDSDMVFICWAKLTSERESLKRRPGETL